MFFKMNQTVNHFADINLIAFALKSNHFFLKNPDFTSESQSDNGKFVIKKQDV